MRQLCMRGLAELRCCTLFLLLVWDRYYRLRRSTPTSALHFTSNLFTSNSCDTVLYFIITPGTLSILKNWGSHASLHSFKSFKVRQKKNISENIYSSVKDWIMLDWYFFDAGWRSYKSIKSLVLKQSAGNFITDYHTLFCFRLQQSTHFKSSHL